jgi:hypothetical protein
MSKRRLRAVPQATHDSYEQTPPEVPRSPCQPEATEQDLIQTESDLEPEKFTGIG